MNRPINHLDWTEGEATKVQEPTDGKKLLGWTPSERPPAEYMNWLFFRQDEWNKYFDGVIDQVLANGTVYDAVVGVGGTHGSLKDLMLDPNIASLKSILVIDAEVVTSSPIVIDQPDMSFFFKPQATIAFGDSLIGMQIDADRVRINGAKFLNFVNAGNGEAIRVSAGINNVMIRDSFFTNNDTTVKDNGTNTSLSGNVEV